MGVIKYTTSKINVLLEKVDKAPEKIENGKTPVFVSGTTTTLEAGLSATADIVQDGVDETGNPKYKINLGIPKGLDGTGGGDGEISDSVQWSKVINKPSWLNHPTKPTYTASEVGALPVGTKIPSKTSELENDSKFIASTALKTINGLSIVGEGNIQIEGGSSGGGVGNLNVTNSADLKANGTYTFKPSADKSTTGVLELLQSASSTKDGLMSSNDKKILDGLPTVIKFDESFMALTNSSTKTDIANVFSKIDDAVDYTDDEVLYSYIAIFASTCFHENNMGNVTSKFYINRRECMAYGRVDEIKCEATLELTYPVGNGKLKTTSIFGSSKTVESGYQYSFKCTVSETGDDEYYLPEKVLTLKSSSTSDDVVNAFGGVDNVVNVLKSIGNAKKVYLYNNIYRVPVSVYQLSSTFTFLSYTDPYFKRTSIIYIGKSGAGSVQEYDLIPYDLKEEIVSITSSSTSDEISTAVDGESGMKSIIEEMKKGRELQINMKPGGVTQVAGLYKITSYLWQENVNNVTGDMSIWISSMGYGFAKSFVGGTIYINYTKATNTFTAQALRIDAVAS